MSKLLTTVFCLLAFFALSQAFHASVKDKNNYCIMFEGNITGSITYEKMDKTTSSMDFAVDEGSLNISGECLHLLKNVSSGESLSVSFLPVNSSESQQQWTLKIDFVNPKGNAFEVDSIQLLVPFNPKLNASVPTGVYKLEDGGDKWSVTDDAYACSSSKFGLTNQSSIEFHNVRVLAFAELTEDKFPSNQMFNECALDSKTSEIVPIIVGACLAGLVVVVLIAYLIGRARAKRQGYASV